MLYFWPRKAFKLAGQRQPAVAPGGRVGHLPASCSACTAASCWPSSLPSFVWWLLERSTLGFEMRAVGANPDAARTAGMNVPQVYICRPRDRRHARRPGGAMQVLGLQTHSPTRSRARWVSTRSRSRCSVGPRRSVPCWPVSSSVRCTRAACRCRPRRRTARADQVLQALIVLFVAAPALVRGLFRSGSRVKDPKSRRRDGEHERDRAPAAPQPETEVRDRADVRRQIRLMVTMAIVFVPARLLRARRSRAPTSTTSSASG